jgi:hypothetical protein
MDDDARVIDKGWDALPDYADKSSEADDAVTVSISTTPGEWLVNTVDAVVVPMSMAELVDALQKHKLTQRSLVWRAGMQEWAPVERVPQLKLAARLPNSAAPVSAPAPTATPTPSGPPRPSSSMKPPPKPTRTPVPSAPPPAAALPSRKATLPFGLPNPAPSASRPGNARPSSSPHASTPAPLSEDTGVLAVYERPAATISFDLSPDKPLQAAAVAPTAHRPQPQTLAPLTSDSAPRRMSAAPNADLSVVAAAHFRDVQRSSKRLVLVSSLVSAAAASLLTFWFARGSTAPSPVLAPPAAAAALAAAPIAAPPAPAPVEPPPSAPAATEAATAAAVAPAAGAVAKPKAHRPRVAKLASTATKTSDAGNGDTAAVKLPSAEPNPYDVKLDEEAPKAKPVADSTRGSGLDDSKLSETASGSATPGF